MTVLRQLTLVVCAVAIAGCAETRSNGDTDSTKQLNLDTASQAAVAKLPDAVDSEAPNQESTEATSEPVVEKKSVNAVGVDILETATSSQSSQSESEEKNLQESSNSGFSAQQSTFNKHMTAVHRAIEQKQWDEASRLLEEALQLEPRSTAAQDLREFVAMQQELLHQQDLIRKFTTAIQVERWLEASEIANDMKTQDSATLEQIQISKILVNAERLADRLLSDPKRLSRPSVQSEVERLETLTENVNPGERVGEKLLHLRELSNRWTTPVVVNLNSDGNTTVILRPGRSLGQFRSQKIQLMPGEYVLIGRRDGFREVRLPLRLDPNNEPRTLEIKALERF